MSYAYYRSITIDHTQVPSTQSNFPTLVKIDSAVAGTTLKTVGNGGHIQNTVTQSGGNAVTMPADLIVTSDSGGTTKIPWEVESYDGTNGILWLWVKLASVSSSVDTVFYIFYDDAGVTTQQNTSSISPSNVWDTNFQGVYHFGDGSTLGLNDSTANAVNGTNHSATVTSSPTGSGISFNGSQWSNLGNGTYGGLTDHITYEMWVNPVSKTGNPFMFSNDNGGSNANNLWLWGAASGVTIGFNGTQVSGDNSFVLPTNAWSHIVIAYDGVNIKTYSNGALTNTYPATGNATINTGLEGWNIGRYDAAFGLWYTGSLAELRVSNTNRSTDWVATEYNNQNAPQTFITLGAETANVSATNSGFFLFM